LSLAVNVGFFCLHALVASIIQTKPTLAGALQSGNNHVTLDQVAPDKNDSTSRIKQVEYPSLILWY